MNTKFLCSKHSLVVFALCLFIFLCVSEIYGQTVTQYIVVETNTLYTSTVEDNNGKRYTAYCVNPDKSAPVIGTIYYPAPPGYPNNTTTPIVVPADSRFQDKYIVPIPDPNPKCSISAISTNVGNCSSPSNVYPLSGTIAVSNPPTDSNALLYISVDNVVKQIIQPPFSSTINYNITNVMGLVADGASHTITTRFNSNGTDLCTASTIYTSPPSCGCINPTPTVNSPTICAGQLANLIVSNCSGTVTWNDGGIGNPRSVSPLSTTSYTAICNVGSCTGTAMATVTVTPKPTPTPTVNSPTICAGQSAILTVSNCAGSVSWNDGTTGLAKTVSPTTTTSYTATCTVGTAPCVGTGTATATVTVTPKPTLTIETTGCSTDLTTYSISFTSNGSVVSDKGTMLATTISGIPSGQTVTLTASLNGCTTVLSVNAPNCNCPSQPIALVPSQVVCKGNSYPKMEASITGSGTIEWYKTNTSTEILATGTTFTPTGIVTANDSFFVAVKPTDSSCPLMNRTKITITTQTCPDNVDVALKKYINKKIAKIGDELTYTLEVFNQSKVGATGVEVTDSIATSIQFLAGSFVASRGNATISGNVIKWIIGDIAANGDTVKLSYKVKAVSEGVHFNTAEICKTNEKDIDSTPCNNKEEEDDLDRQCFSVPIKLCAGEKVQMDVALRYTEVSWFKDGQEIISWRGRNSVLAESVGTYTFTSTNVACPVSGCCPIIIEPGDNCCPVQLCIPLTVKRKKR